MLTNSFIHTPGIGYITEKKIWSQGVTSWEQFRRNGDDLGLSARQQDAISQQIEESLPRLKARDYRFFGQHLPNREHWRVYPEFSDSIAFLDIETTGLLFWDDITMIGIHDGRETRTLINGQDLDEFPEAIGKYSVIVTFFGSCFDLPFLRRKFPDVPLDQIHLDLCYLLRRLGYSGGLKSIEVQLGIRRSQETQGLDGFDAVRLWDEYESGSREALELLLHYNREDVENLATLLNIAYDSLKSGCLQAAD